MPPSPFAPWQVAHFWAKIAFPCAGVPDPAGKPFPSGKTEISQPAASASLMVLPNFGASAAKAAVINPHIAVARKTPLPPRAKAHLPKRKRGRPTLSLKERGDSFLNIDMGDGSVRGDGPRGNLVHMVHREAIHIRRSPRLAPFGDQLLTGGLHITTFVGCAAHDDRRLTSPVPRHPEAGQRFRQHRCLQRGERPGPAAIGGNFDLFNPSVPGPCNARDFVVAR